MSGKRKKPAHAKNSNWQSAQRLIAGAIFFIVLGSIVAFALLSNPSTVTPPTAPANLDKSKGAANAPVTVVEYGDFQ